MLKCINTHNEFVSLKNHCRYIKYAQYIHTSIYIDLDFDFEKNIPRLFIYGMSKVLIGDYLIIWSICEQVIHNIISRFMHSCFDNKSFGVDHFSTFWRTYFSDLFWFKKVESQYTLCILFTPRSYLSSFKKDEHELISLDAFFIVVLQDMTFFFLEQQQVSWKKKTQNIFKISYIFKLFLKSNRDKKVPKLPSFWVHWWAIITSFKQSIVI